jgi:hypothetical protein
MVENESALLQRFVGTGDTEAFAQIVRQYAGLVYSTCLRILAEQIEPPATQETFFSDEAGREVMALPAGCIAWRLARPWT